MNGCSISKRRSYLWERYPKVLPKLLCLEHPPYEESFSGLFFLVQKKAMELHWDFLTIMNGTERSVDRNLEIRVTQLN